MSDITACGDKRCPSRTLCYRYTCEKDTHWQSYLAKSPRKLCAVSCDEFWSNKGTPDPTDLSVNETPECRCDLYGMVHKWNPACQLFEIISKPWIGKKVKRVRKNRKR